MRDLSELTDAQLESRRLMAQQEKDDLLAEMHEIVIEQERRRAAESMKALLAQLTPEQRKAIQAVK